MSEQFSPKVVFIGIPLDMDAADVVDFVSSCSQSTECVQCPPKIYFDGYDEDPLEVWEIDRCVDICERIVMANLLRRLDPRSAFFVFRVATGMQERVSEEWVITFSCLMQGKVSAVEEFLFSGGRL